MAGDQALQAFLDRAAIVRVVQGWAFWRDNGRWDELRAAYAPDGLQTTSWTMGTAAQFVDRCIEGAKKPGARRSMHSIGASLVEVNGERALAETRRTIFTRGFVHGVEVDVTNYGTTLDRFVKLNGEWRIKQRNAVYERDRMDPVDPNATLKLDPAELARFPEGYRYLAYLQSGEGERINPDLPTPGSEAAARLYASAKAWLAGKPAGGG
jgi:hypothetical protein